MEENQMELSLQHIFNIAMQQQVGSMPMMPAMPMMPPMQMMPPLPMLPPMSYMNMFANQSLEHPQQSPQHDEDHDDDELDDEEQRTLFCSNLDERVTDEILYEVFLTAGPIESCRIPKDNAGRQRNFGFVTYVHKCAVPFALQLYEGLELFKKKVGIKEQGSDRARQQPQRRQAIESPYAMSGLRNPFAAELAGITSGGNADAMRRGRHSLHGGTPYDRRDNNDARRRSDSAVLERNRPRNQPHHQQQHQSSHNQNRRHEQRHSNQSRRRI